MATPKFVNRAPHADEHYGLWVVAHADDGELTA